MITDFKKYLIMEGKEIKYTKINLPKDIYDFYKLFKKAGYDLYVVGGAVRDHLSGMVPHDFDLVTNALPDEILEILKDYRASLQGEHFGVIRVYTEDEPVDGYEIASYRKDISKGRDTKGDEEKVMIGNGITLKDDLERRDLTINALVYDIENEEIIDYVDGLNDLKNGIIRTVGDPSKRFDEDRLRILRTLRFSARSKYKLDQQTIDAIKKDNRLRNIGKGEDVSQERIIDEFKKLFDYAKKKNDVSILIDYIKYIKMFNLEHQMFPGVEVNFNYNDLKTLNIYIFISQFFKNLTSKNVQLKLIDQIKFPKNLIYVSAYLLKWGEEVSDDENSYELLLGKQKYHISNDLLIEYAKYKNVNRKYVDKFIKYVNLGITTDGMDLINQGFKGSELGKEKKRRELEIYKNL